ncbi:hypothetical protein D5039_22025 [Verminephrobacter aporrectodeae subsp. tuberculatae]|uniref:Winged helix-turn-helix domain-containing protein n=1 Tax=Verminephrobacter aporrectodeae subsp. tuberculatae TaxID=1110392 RepID=A0ABT3KZF3_9BURK|nr:hypothetical protein [Verminephrobacter aporrectodeae]MCW5323721.1 hypothetical protein [Verminephrobacter aporrectodeae subsp. tuberculatae]
MSAVAQTSLDAYRSLPIAGYLQPKEKQVMAAFERNPGARYTRLQLSEITGMPLHSICGRVRSLLDKKQIAVRGDAIDPATRKRQELLGLPVGHQGALF